ncbi:GSCFA domain-containing protein [Rubinisphaera margarita]|uniref:GSCFA domain-containing protein n=1 Tax=Rubinisphaera margarita TaxID=2909586 RepID=UPI001EE8AD32|nr:GSCFA domain-containing protein [Rubinisphaera margarita]MCG6157346.1 GSCFA domain-containing protein [Rubinisphaera margarita]
MLPPVHYRQGQEKKVAHGTWYRGEHCNFIASKGNLAEPDSAAKYVLHGWTPELPFLTRKDCFTAFGSCFAAHLTKFLRAHRYQVGSPEWNTDSYIMTYGAGINNTFAIRQQLEWALENRTFQESLWYDQDRRLVPPDVDAQLATREILKSTSVFIFTLGLSEIWYSRETGEVFWRAIPQDVFDPSRHGFRVSTCAENAANLEAIYQLVRHHRPDATIIFTLSPVPLVATFRPVSCITANSESKAILRASLGEVVRSHSRDNRLFYFPSYELVKEYFTDPYEQDNRHVQPEIVEQVMNLFAQHYLADF